MNSYAKGFASGSGVSVLAAALGYFGYQKQQERAERRYARYGLPERLTPSTLKYGNHALDYDPSKKIPLWVAEHVTKDTVTECLTLSSAFGTGGERVSRDKASFKPDPGIAKKAMNDTFLLTNILPQDYKNNGGYWNMMEIFVRDLTDKVSDVFVISGPVFRADEDGEKKFVKYQVIGKNKVAVPTHLFKVVLAETGGTSYLAAFVVPNSRLPLNTPLTDYKVPLEELEREIGYSLFPRLKRDRYSDLCQSPLGCELMPLRDFLRIIYERKISNSRRLFWLERQWAKAERDGMHTDPAIRKMYEEKKRELSEKEQQLSEPLQPAMAPA